MNWARSSVVSSWPAGQRGGDHRLVHGRDDHEVEGLGGDVHDEVGAELAERGESILGDGAGDHRLAGEVRQAEAHQFGERADDDVGVLDGEMGDRVADPAERAQRPDP